MSKSTKEQVKFFIETMTDDMHNTTQHEIAETLLSKFDECESLQAKLLAYEQAAKNPVAYRNKFTGQFFTLEQQPDAATDAVVYEPVFLAAPVLPKQPELLSIGELLHRLEEQTGEKWVEESVQHVIPGQLTQRMAEEKALSLGAVLSDDEADAFADGWNACRAEMLKAQPVMAEQWRSFVTDADIAALHRFAECCDDPESGGHDLEKEQVQRLEKIGALQRSGRISYITDFGDYLISVAPAQESE